MIQQAITAIMMNDPTELWILESAAKEYNWICLSTKQAFLDLLNDIHQRPEEEAVCFLSALRFCEINFMNMNLFVQMLKR